MGAAYNITGLTGSVAAAPSATFGTTSKQVAVTGGPSFDGSSGTFTSNATFPLIATSLQGGSSGLNPAPGSTGATLTVVSTSQAAFKAQLVIPSLNIDETFSGFGSVVSGLEGPTYGYSYVVLGQWGFPSSTGGSQTMFVSGYETPTTALPTNGSANFSGTAQAIVFKSMDGKIAYTTVNGSAAIGVNFGTGQVSGGLTKMQQWDGLNGKQTETFLPWNDVSVNANLAGGTSRFSGSTGVTSAPGTTFSASSSATGHIDGALFGPAAQNIGAVWSLSDGTVSAMGTIAGKQ
jgi:hypothetical protein